MRSIAKSGGEATKRKHGPEYYKEIAAMGGRASKGKKKTKRQPAQPPTTISVSPYAVYETLDALIAELEK